MRKLIAIITIISIWVMTAIAQDEGVIVKRERIERDKGIFIGGGISIVGNSNFADYSSGINFEGGYVKRVNRVFSIGGSISYLNFNYDPSILKRPPAQYQDPTNFYVGYVDDNNGNSILYGYLLDLTGANISILSVAANLKVNFVPVKDNSVVSVYGFAKPFIAMASRSDLSANADIYELNSTGDGWNSNPIGKYPLSYAGESKITGGIFIGPGIEFSPAKPISFFLQASFGYTFPINVVDTRSYPNDGIIDFRNDQSGFPLRGIGFTSINFSGGILFNLD
jgi:hypothetical protein